MLLSFSYIICSLQHSVGNLMKKQSTKIRRASFPERYLAVEFPNKPCNTTILPCSACSTSPSGLGFPPRSNEVHCNSRLSATMKQPKWQRGITV